MTKPEKAGKTKVFEQVLPLVLEIIPGQAAEGLIDVYEPGSYEGKPLRELCKMTLNEKNWSIEDQQILEDVNRQLAGGRLICRGRAIEGTALDQGVVEETEAGERYLYVSIRAIKPQEGGSLPSRPVVQAPRTRGGDRDGATGKETAGPRLPEMPRRAAATHRAQEGGVRGSGPRSREGCTVRK